MGQCAVNAAMQAPSGGVGRIGAVHRAGVIGVNLDQARGRDARKMAAIGVDQKPRAFRIGGKAKVVGHRLVQVQLDRPAKGRGKVDAFGPVGDIGV